MWPTYKAVVGFWLEFLCNACHLSVPLFHLTVSRIGLSRAIHFNLQPWLIRLVWQMFPKSIAFLCFLTLCVCVCDCVCSVTQSCLTLWDPRDSSPPGSSVHGIFQVKLLNWVALSYSRWSSQPRDQTWVSCVSCIGRWILYHCTTWEIPTCTVAYWKIESYRYV